MPWSIKKHNDACFIVHDHNGHALGYVYFEEEPAGGRRRTYLTRGEARRFAANIAKLTELVRKP